MPQAAVVSTTRDALVARTKGPHAAGAHFYHPDMHASRKTLAAQDLGCTYETLRVVYVGLLGGVAPDCAQIIRHQQAGMGCADVEGDFQGVEQDVKSIKETDHFSAEVLGFEVCLETFGVDGNL